MRALQLRLLCVVIIIGLSVSCGGGSSNQGSDKQVPTSVTTDLDRTFVAILEESWNFYLRQKIFLGPTYFGNVTSFGRNGDSLQSLELMSDYPTYRALATKGMITLSELSIADAPPGVYSSGLGVRLERAATVTLTESGARAGDVDKKANTVTFVLGTYRVEKITLNERVVTSDGDYRIVEGTHVLDVAPAFGDIWAELGWPTYRERRFRVLFKRDTNDPLFKRTGQEWRVAMASNGKFTAEDRGPRNGNFESENIPPTLDQLRQKGR